MSTDQDNFAGMTAEQKVKALILLSIRGDRAAVPPINKDNIDDTFSAYDYTDAANEVREGECVTAMIIQQWKPRDLVYASVVTDRAGRFMGLKMTIDRRALDAASDDLNTTLRPEFGAIDGMDTEAQRDAAARMKARIDSNLEDAGFEGMRVQIELQPARARLVKVGL